MKTYYKIIESRKSDAGEVVGRCAADSEKQARAKFGIVDGGTNDGLYSVVEEADMYANVYDPRNLVRE